ncbi:G2H3 [Mytilus edulis]|uniref:G2H3 n=1 Tax=Mytilus edulis TaxID=6550 RepID=A0A8S3Q3R7_MYTED|nr:G2H3 [Mytilus edulis]
MADVIHRVVREARAVLNTDSSNEPSTGMADDFVRTTSQIFRRPVQTANDKDQYYYAGVMIALSLVHGGPAPHCFSHAFVEALENGPKGVVVSLDDLPDFELRNEETDVTFETILMFTTGSKSVPPLGFDPSPSVAFWKERFPKATTCTNTLVLPTLCTSYESFVQT